MPLFSNYDKAGKGVRKDVQEKRAFFRFFEVFFRKFWKMLQLNIIYILFCLPIVTIGPATAAMVSITHNFVNEIPVFLLSDFWDEFKKNFKQGIIVGIVDILIFFVYAIALNFYANGVTEDTTFIKLMQVVVLSTAMFIIMMHFYVYLQIVKLDLPLMSIFKNSFLLVFLGIKRNFVTLAVVLGFGMLFYSFYPLTLFVLPVLPAAWLAFLSVFMSYPVIQKYIINPFYEKNELPNPEQPQPVAAEDVIFTDRGGFEEAFKGTGRARPKVTGKDVKTKGKTIK